MKILILYLLTLPTILTAQEERDTILIKRSFFGERYIYDGRDVGLCDLYWITRDYPEAHALALKSEKKWKLARAVTSPLLGLLLWSTDNRTPRDTQTALHYAMVGVVVAAIPITISGSTQYRKSIKSFNEGR